MTLVNEWTSSAQIPTAIWSYRIPVELCSCLAHEIGLPLKTTPIVHLLFNQMYGYTGLIQAAGPRSFITKVDYAWNPAWGDQLRHFKLEGDKLLITSAEQTVPAHGTRLIVGNVLWVREGS